MTRSAYSRKYRYLRTLLTNARKAAGITQIALARQLGRPQSFVSKFERGERRLDVVEFLEIAHTLKLDPKRVLGEVDQM